MMLPIPIAEATITRLRWAPWARHRWRVEVTAGPSSATCVTRWWAEAMERADDLMWHLG